MGYLDTKLQYFPNDIKQTRPLGELTLYQWLYSIKHPKESVMQLFKDIEQASAVGDLKTKAKLKKSLYYVVPSTFSDGQGRSYSNIENFTGLLVIDVDGLEVEYAKEFKEYLFYTYPFFIAVYLSPSRKGVKGLVRIPICKTVEEYKGYYNGLMSIMQEYKGMDFATGNCVLAHFITYDHSLLYRLDAVEWKGIGMRIDEFKVSNETLEELTDIDPKDVEGIKLMLQRMMAKIDVEQQGHLILRNTSLIAGGLTRYIPMDEMQEYMFELIDNSSYLQKGLHGYRKTCMQMLKLGATNQIEYER